MDTRFTKKSAFFFFPEKGETGEKQPLGDGGLVFFYMPKAIKEGRNKNAVFFRAKRMINNSPYKTITILLSGICTCIGTAFIIKTPDGGLKMSLQYIGNVYRFVKSIHLTLR